MADVLHQFWVNEDGQDLVEYSLLIVFIAIAALAVMQPTGSSITPVWVNGNATISNAVTEVS